MHDALWQYLGALGVGLALLLFRRDATLTRFAGVALDELIEALAMGGLMALFALKRHLLSLTKAALRR